MAGKPEGGRAVMEARAPAAVEADDPLRALHRTLDLFCTPPWAARRGAELIQMVAPACRHVREPACGAGHMAFPLMEYFEVTPTDVHAHEPWVETRDWLDDAAWSTEPDCDFVVTNPPFAIASEFVIRGLRRARLGVALLVRLAFLEGGERYSILGQGAEFPLTLLSPFSERVPMTLGKWDPASSSATAYAWLIWCKGREPMAPIWSGPGTRERLWKPDDAERFGWKAPLPLFEEL